MTNIPNAFSMGYYPDGRRAWKLTGGVKYYYVYDGDTLVYEMNSSGVATNLFGYGAAGLAQRRVPSISVTYHYSFDPSGNVVQRHTTGTTLADFTTLYDGFGQQLGCISPNSGAQASAAGNEMIGFAGQFGCWTDNETSMNPTTGAPNRRFPWVWMGHREYDPLACRFLTRDPIGYDGGINLYAYAGNNPIMYVDFSGLDKHDGIHFVLGIVSFIPAVGQVASGADPVIYLVDGKYVLAKIAAIGVITGATYVKEGVKVDR